MNTERADMEANEMKKLVEGVRYWSGVRDEFQAKVIYAEKELRTHYSLISDLQNRAMKESGYGITETPLDLEARPRDTFLNRALDKFGRFKW